MIQIEDYSAQGKLDPLPDSKLSRDFGSVKFCDKDFNIARGCNSLKIGTLKYYRKIEGELSDKWEGIPAFNQSGVHENIIAFNNIIVNKPIPNPFVYCVSLDDKPKFNYNDKFYILNTPRFFELIGDLLVQNLQQEDIEGSVNFSDASKLLLKSRGREIVYEKASNYSGFNFPSSRGIEFLDSIVFRKPLKYHKENEARSAYFLGYQVSENRMALLNIIPDYKILDISSIRDEINQLVSVNVPQL